MPRTLAAIKVCIDDGPTFKYPEFNLLETVKAFIDQNPGKDWSNYIDLKGSGFLYDNAGDFARDDGETVEGQWCAALLVPLAFAQEAVAVFPDRVSRLTELQLKAFYNKRHAAKFQDELFDANVLEGIKLKQDLALPLTINQKKALDPKNPMPGIQKNARKTWAGYKVDRNLLVDESS